MNMNMRIKKNQIAKLIATYLLAASASVSMAGGQRVEEQNKLQSQIDIKAIELAQQLPAVTLDKANLKWAEELALKSRSAVFEHIESIIQDPSKNKNPEIKKLAKEMKNPRPQLQIFISSSMPISLIKGYAKEAAKYNGVLVMRGLPGGSMRKLTDLMMKISDKNSAAAQIDDEAFNYFGINQVPAIVLSNPESIFLNQSKSLSEGSKKRGSKFDKITGSITIKAALELFADNGSMQRAARGLLR
jgi:type-F conjugative transfer system pilin assembly protein TrbC